MKKNQTSFTIGKGYFESSEPTTIENFLSASIEDLLVQHHRRNGENSLFYVEGIKETDRYMFIISQDKELIQELSMLKPNQEKTLDIFQPSLQNNFTSVTLHKLVQQLESNQGDYEIEFDGRAYSFRLVKGIKVKNTLEKIDNYFEEASNMLEYDQQKKVKP